MLIAKSLKVLEASMAVGHVDYEERNVMRVLLHALHATILCYPVVDTDLNLTGWMVES